MKTFIPLLGMSVASFAMLHASSIVHPQNATQEGQVQEELTIAKAPLHPFIQHDDGTTFVTQIGYIGGMFQPDGIDLGSSGISYFPLIERPTAGRVATAEVDWGNGFEVFFGFSGGADGGLLGLRYAYLTSMNPFSALHLNEDEMPSIIPAFPTNIIAGTTSLATAIEARYNLHFFQRGELSFARSILENKTFSLLGICSLDMIFFDQSYLNHIAMDNPDSCENVVYTMRESASGFGPKVGIFMTQLLSQNSGLRLFLGGSSPLTNHLVSYANDILQSETVTYTLNSAGSFTKLHQIIDCEITLFFSRTNKEGGAFETYVGWKTMQGLGMSYLTAFPGLKQGVGANVQFSGLTAGISGKF